MDDITFSPGEARDERRMVAMFWASVGDRRVSCAISFEALQDQRHFHGDPGQPLDTFRRHRSVIEGLARRLIQQRRFEPDGSILNRSQDW